MMIPFDIFFYRCSHCQARIKTDFDGTVIKVNNNHNHGPTEF